MALSKIDVANMVENQMPQANLADNVNFRNIIINGDMSIAQRSTSETNVSTGYRTCDRWRISRGAGTITMSQATDAPTGSGFVKSLKFLEAGSGSSPSAGDANIITQRIEGQNLQYLLKGTSSAKSLTLSFWIKASVTGTYIANLTDDDNSRFISKAYTVSSANTWEYKTVTFEGDTTGAFANDNGRSLDINLYFTAGSNFTSGTLNTTWNSYTAANQAVGQVHALASANDYVQWTGVQLEAGQTASDFEFLPVDVNRFRCYRYYYQYVGGAVNLPIGLGTYFSSSQVTGVLYPPNRPFRATPTLDIDTGTNYYYAIRNNGTASFDNFILDKTSPELLEIRNTSTSGNAGDAAFLRTNSASARMALDAEL